MTSPSRLLLRPSEVGDLISYCETKVRSLIKSGELRAVRVDGVLRVPASAVQEWIEKLPEAKT